MQIKPPTVDNSLDRRGFLVGSGHATLSAAAIAMLAGCTGLARSAGATGKATEGDIAILNTALSAEREAIAAYQLGAESGLLQPAVKQLAITFQGHHREHADLLAATVRKLGGALVDPPAGYDFSTVRLNNQPDVLRFAAGLEKGAVSAYLGAVPLFTNRDLAQAAASILGDEAMHWAVLRQALGQAPVPSAFVS